MSLSYFSHSHTTFLLCVSLTSPLLTSLFTALLNLFTLSFPLSIFPLCYGISPSVKLGHFQLCSDSSTFLWKPLKAEMNPHDLTRRLQYSNVSRKVQYSTGQHAYCALTPTASVIRGQYTLTPAHHVIVVCMCLFCVCVCFKLVLCMSGLCVCGMWNTLVNHTMLFSPGQLLKHESKQTNHLFCASFPSHCNKSSCQRIV